MTYLKHSVISCTYVNATFSLATFKLQIPITVILEVRALYEMVTLYKGIPTKFIPEFKQWWIPFKPLSKQAERGERCYGSVYAPVHRPHPSVYFLRYTKSGPSVSDNECPYFFGALS